MMKTESSLMIIPSILFFHSIIWFPLTGIRRLIFPHYTFIVMTTTNIPHIYAFLTLAPNYFAVNFFARQLSSSSFPPPTSQTHTNADARVHTLFKFQRQALITTTLSFTLETIIRRTSAPRPICLRKIVVLERSAARRGPMSHTELD